jgi:hypothetical protein
MKSQQMSLMNLQLSNSLAETQPVGVVIFQVDRRVSCHWLPKARTRLESKKAGRRRCVHTR